MKNKSVVLVSIVALFLCVWFAACNFDNGNVESSPPLAWRASGSIFQDIEGSEGIDISSLYTEFNLDPETKEAPLSIAYGNGVIVVGNTIDSRLAYSTDKGATWDFSDSRLGDIIKGVVFSKGIFVALSTGDNIATSDDGANWDPVINNTSSNAAQEIISAGDVFFTRHKHQNNQAWLRYSRNGHKWDDLYGEYKAMKNIYDIASDGEGTYIYVGNTRQGKDEDGNVIPAYGAVNCSFDGKFWEQAQTWIEDEKEAMLEYLTAAAYGNGVFVAGGEGSKVIVSEDGKTWDFGGNSGLQEITALTYGDRTFVALCGTDISVSFNNGKSWMLPVDTPVNTGFFNKLVYDSGYFIAVGSNFARQENGENGYGYYYDGLIVYSADNGQTWYTVELPHSGIILDVVSVDGTLVAVSSTGKVYNTQVK